MLSAIAIVPSAPVMVPELAGGAAPELADLREAVFTAVAGLPSRWVAVGVGPCDQVVGPDQAGTFAGYGVDVRVALSPGGDGDPVAMPLCALITGWVRGAARSEASAEVRVFSEGHDIDAALAHGERLRAEIGEGGNPVGVLVVADGANTLTPSAPGGFDPDSVAVQAALDDALAGGETAPLARLPASVVGRVAFGVLAGLVGPGPRSAKELYRGAPYGVGYFTGLWQPR
ncbi:hypothetical protein AU190_22415 [Mycolicibacterium acapulense]|uniref:Uncharacterized protein n=1 Tax=Mycobacterium lehmannii TaxID=2048550 RepID=A0A101A8U2_9MYCO|nr:hypothetical protein [Mycobacterium lehmannii]KUH98040.1 hypothetical protein AU190_22415 [Mycolicibacterium acapulense]KUH98929.1 hypothetical protein AU189_05930 [Mycolicibacterium acapulense]KUI18016.1 hypothetical protein AU192_02115 [Mycobacterium lehmannii]KUI18577.1 hypothetical protein AU191_03655 [Mycolicibacterium acapulense]